MRSEIGKCRQIVVLAKLERLVKAFEFSNPIFRPTFSDMLRTASVVLLLQLKTRIQVPFDLLPRAPRADRAASEKRTGEPVLRSSSFGSAYQIGDFMLRD